MMGIRSEELGIRDFTSFPPSPVGMHIPVTQEDGSERIKGAGTSVPPNATEVASPIRKALPDNAYRHYSLFTIHYSLTDVQDSPIYTPRVLPPLWSGRIPMLERGNEMERGIA